MQSTADKDVETEAHDPVQKPHGEGAERRRQGQRRKDFLDKVMVGAGQGVDGDVEMAGDATRKNDAEDDMKVEANGSGLSPRERKCGWQEADEREADSKRANPPHNPKSSTDPRGSWRTRRPTSRWMWRTSKSGSWR